MLLNTSTSNSHRTFVSSPSKGQGEQIGTLPCAIGGACRAKIASDSQGQFAPMYKIGAHGMSPAHVPPFLTLGIVLKKQVVLAVEIHQSIRIVHPVPRRRKVNLRAQRLVPGSLIARGHCAGKEQYSGQDRHWPDYGHAHCVSAASAQVTTEGADPLPISRATNSIVLTPATLALRVNGASFAPSAGDLASSRPSP